MSIENFNEKLNQKTHIPGGGAVAAIVGSLAASLSGMVAQYTLENEKYEQHESKVEKALEKLIHISDVLMDCADEDSRAFDKVSKAYKGIGDKDLALREAALVSAKISKLGYEIMEISYMLYKYGNKNLKSDAQISCYLGYSVYNSGLILVKVNAKSIKDKEIKEKIVGDIDKIIITADKLLKDIRKEIDID